MGRWSATISLNVASLYLSQLLAANVAKAGLKGCFQSRNAWQLLRGFRMHLLASAGSLVRVDPEINEK